jgi:hypothetical protein
MKINTKFDIGDVVELKYEFTDAEHKKMAYEIMGISTQSSYVGTEVFYHCRALHMEAVVHKDTVYGWRLRRGYRTNVNNDNQLGTNKFYETEIVEASKNIKNIIEREYGKGRFNTL